MALTAPLFYLTVVAALDLVVGLIASGLTVVSFGHCLTQRADAFTAIGTLPKPGWLALLGLTGLLSLFQTLFAFVDLVNGGGGGGGLPFGLLAQLIGAAAGLVYLLDVRAGLRGLTDGRGMW
ncbi:hypothetical protein GCM10010123_21500 [Pilimelia anulata]|uniref:Uncharacterized protein n=1 Tax=Pilimelia anulata TaxID=53371 RepID=A0A8J3FCF9_9ACTN|nr:DUF2516 family protein [Pilimelia anulata]GGJ91383.1 hypothetical protein GCM10010123_21500 [Pilimelia anulata]